MSARTRFDAHRFRLSSFLPLLILLVLARAFAQDRQPAVAGPFYPDSPTELRSMLKELFAQAAPSKDLVNVVALISPHAGYVFSGGVAASAYNQINRTKHYDNIFILGPSHHVGFEGAAIYSKGNFITPLGTVKVNTQLRRAHSTTHVLHIPQ